MKKSTNLMESLYSICDWIMRFSIINMLWVIFNLPIIICGILLFFTGQQDGDYTLVLLIILMVPFLYFPSTTAMFSAIRQWVLQGTISPLFKSYWRYYKENYKKSLFGGFIITAAWVVLIADYYYFVDKNPLLLYVLIIIGVFLFVFSINFFSVVSHYHLNLFALLKNLLLTTIGNPISALLILVGSCMILYLSFYVLHFLLPLFTGTLIAYLSFNIFHRMYLTTLEKQERVVHR